ncbi:hypothetical protein J437_LFUL018541 [Ladona fulva]|uniref:Cytochrome P450 n=1 Tax=Ladona fulva TaxID=123851 RepID=A0A8K0PB96_LADFU|nr:hypothetical protein J437_LFUL018541 [Ladona fulva]
MKTSNSIAATMYHLSKNPEKQEFLFKELKKILPNKNDVVTVEKLENMKYLKACIKESMRISSIAVGTMRGSTKDIVIGNYRIPKDVNIMMPHLMIGMTEEHMIMPNKYLPERWLQHRPADADGIGSAEDFDKSTAVKPHPFVFVPFGFGPRMCVGRRFAELEMHTLLAKMIRNFKLEYNHGEMKFESKILHRPVCPLKFKLTDRAE